MRKFKDIIRANFVRPVDEIMAPLNKIVVALLENSQRAVESGKKLDFKADYALAEAEEFKRKKEAESLAARQDAGVLYDTAAASANQAEKLKALFT